MVFGVCAVVFNLVLVFSNVEAFPVGASIYNALTIALETLYFVFIFVAKAKNWIR